MARSAGKDETSAMSNNDSEPKKRQHDKALDGKSNARDEEAEPHTKKAKTTRSSRSSGKTTASIDKGKLDQIMSAYGVLPLQDTAVSNPTKAEPETILATLYLAMLTSARISHQLAYKSVRCLIEAGYHHLDTLKQSTWEDRTKVLTEGGYTRYREKTATALGELADFLDGKYDGDLNNLLKKADSDPKKVRNLIQEIKGVGKVGTDIFFDAAQGFWPALAPFIDPRSMDTANQVGLGSDVNVMWEAVGKDSVEMCKLSSALTTIRLDKKVKDFQ